MMNVPCDDTWSVGLRTPFPVRGFIGHQANCEGPKLFHSQ